MKYSTWLPKHSPLPRTLADVPSSREEPVLCWYGNHDIREMYVADGTAKCISRVGETYTCSHQPPCVNLLYSAPTRPTKLEDVPDRRVIFVTELHVDDTLGRVLAFRADGKWTHLDGTYVYKIHGADWQLTDHVAELVETEIGVMT